jgi:hypothetical protein
MASPNIRSKKDIKKPTPPSEKGAFQGQVQPVQGQDTHTHSRRNQAHYSRQFAAKAWFEVLQWARANSCPWDEEICKCAAKGGHLDVLLWARANGCP